MRDSRVDVRLAESADAGAVAALLTELGAVDVDEAEAERRLREREEQVLLGCVDGEAGGLVAIKKVLYFGHPRPLAHISALVVGEHWRRAGIAAALVEASRRWAQLHGCVGLELMCALTPAREDAHRFYPAMGFVGNARRYWMEIDPATV